MNADAQPIEQKPEKKTADKRRYMREYKQKVYAETPDKIKELNRMYYAKYKHNISEEECKKYGANLPAVIKLKNSLDQINALDKDLLKCILVDYI